MVNMAVIRIFTAVIVMGTCMLNTLLHTGAQHPDLLWILVPSFLSFVAGLGVASYSDRLRERTSPGQPASDD